LIDDALDQLDNDDEHRVVDEHHICNYNSSSSFQVGESANAKIDRVKGIASEAKGKVVQRETFNS
jgi:hypothetical protein